MADPLGVSECTRGGVIGLFQPGLPGEQTPGLSVRFMGINRKAMGSYAVGLGAALDYLDRIGMENVSRHEHDLLEYGTKQRLQVGRPPEATRS